MHRAEDVNFEALINFCCRKILADKFWIRRDIAFRIYGKKSISLHPSQVTTILSIPHLLLYCIRDIVPDQSASCVAEDLASISILFSGMHTEINFYFRIGLQISCGRRGM